MFGAASELDQQQLSKDYAPNDASGGTLNPSARQLMNPMRDETRARCELIVSGDGAAVTRLSRGRASLWVDFVGCSSVAVWSSFAALRASRRSRRRDVAPQSTARKRHPAALRIHTHEGLGQPRTTGFGAARRRLLRQHRLVVGAGDDELSLRGRLRRSAVIEGSQSPAVRVYASAAADEQRCPGVEINQLSEVTDVTSRIGAATKGTAGERFATARQAAFATIERECASGDDVRWEVVPLYRGGKYDLYQYRRFQDVRLVFAPDFDTAFFGGDPNNFMFPRYNLDLAFLRVYDRGAPYRPPIHFEWSPAGAAAGDLVFVTGHPRTTLRQYTVSQQASRDGHPGARAHSHPRADRSRRSGGEGAFGRQSPDEVAASVIRGTALDDVTARMALMRGGAAALQASNDPLIRLARAIDPLAREARRHLQDDIDADTDRNQEVIAQARFAVLRESVYPDATFTLRLTAGTIRGWEENGREVTPFTTIRGLYDRQTGSPPFALPERWAERKPSVALNTPFNLSADTDIMGGNSGSPVIDRDGRIVGLIFDGNIHSLGGAYWFDPAKNRSVAVDSRGIRQIASCRRSTHPRSPRPHAVRAARPPYSTEAMVSTSSLGSIGLTTWCWKPWANTRSRSVERA
jgi:hypothetical protein